MRRAFTGARSDASQDAPDSPFRARHQDEKPTMRLAFLLPTRPSDCRPVAVRRAFTGTRSDASQDAPDSPFKAGWIYLGGGPCVSAGAGYSGPCDGAEPSAGSSVSDDMPSRTALLPGPSRLPGNGGAPGLPASGCPESCFFIPNSSSRRAPNATARLVSFTRHSRRMTTQKWHA